jgi:F420-dependent methylenetetrahydromethanopterin dehydrogenase
MVMKKQTAVDWLIEQLKTQEEIDYIPSILIEQAKQMEKEQMFEYIKNLYCNGDASLKYHLEEFEQYYDKTYKDEDRPTE